MIKQMAEFKNARNSKLAIHRMPRYHLLPPTVAKSFLSFTYSHLGVGITLCLPKISYRHDKSQPMVPINSLQPHEHHGTIIDGQLFLYEKSLKMEHEP